jgi:hypothetical protein
LHEPPVQRSPAPHVTPHAPQFLLSVLVFTHFPEQLVCSMGHAPTQTPSLQLAPVPTHAVVQLPQCARSFDRSLQESPHAARPPVHVNPQLPALQSGEPPLGAVQTCEHSPQFELSLFGSTHDPPQFVFPAEHTVMQWPALHTSVLAHDTSHAPQ